MYADPGLLFPYFQSFSQEVQQLEEFSRIQKENAFSRNNIFQTSTLSEYDLGGGDLFKAPEPIIEETMMGLDPMAAAISMISCGEDVISPQTMKVADIESFQNEQLLREVLYECEKDLLAKAAMEEPFSGIPDVKIPDACMEVPIAEKDRLILEGPVQKSVSSECLSSMEWIHGAAARLNFQEFWGVDCGDAYGMRRAFSEGDIQTLGNGTTSLIHSSCEKPLTIGIYTIEERKQKLSRYRKKKTKRNFGQKIKYACRKALADNQPRVRGRFAKTEESEVSKK